MKTVTSVALAKIPQSLGDEDRQAFAGKPSGRRLRRGGGSGHPREPPRGQEDSGHAKGWGRTTRSKQPRRRGSVAPLHGRASPQGAPRTLRSNPRQGWLRERTGGSEVTRDHPSLGSALGDLSGKRPAPAQGCAQAFQESSAMFVPRRPPPPPPPPLPPCPNELRVERARQIGCWNQHGNGRSRG